MSASFVSASTQKLSNAAPPVTGVPFTVGMWVWATTAIGASSKAFWGLTLSSSSVDYFILYFSGTGSTPASSVALQASSGTASDSIGVGNPTSAGAWYYVLARCISATNRRLSVLLPGGAVSHAAGTVSVVPATLNTVAIGNRSSSSNDIFWDGNVAEYVMTGTDIQPDGLQTADWLVRQMAYRGPFSIPYLIPNILDYRSLRASAGSETDKSGEFFSGSRGRQVWTNTNRVLAGGHPPLLPGYRSPPGGRSSIMIPV